MTTKDNRNVDQILAEWSINEAPKEREITPATVSTLGLKDEDEARRYYDQFVVAGADQYDANRRFKEEQALQTITKGLVGLPARREFDIEKMTAWTEWHYPLISRKDWARMVPNMTKRGEKLKKAGEIDFASPSKAKKG